jgi:hypothetical protein
MAVYQQIARTGRVRAEFMGDAMENTRRNEFRIYIKGVIIGAAFLTAGQKMKELDTGKVYPFKRALKKRGKKVKTDPTICKFHNLKLNPDGSCPFKVSPLTHSFSSGPIGDTD